MVFGTAVRLLGDPMEAEDVAQTVFLRALERFETLRHSPSVHAWLRTVTTNLCLNYLQRIRSRVRLFSQIGGGSPAGTPPFESALRSPGSVSEDLERREMRARLEEGLRRLPDHQRVPLVLFHFHHQSYREIAHLLAVSLSKVKSDIHRGRQALRQQLGGNDALYRS